MFTIGNNRTSIWLISFALLSSILLCGCQEKPEPIETSYTSPRFTIALDVNGDKEINATLGMRNTGDDLFPADETFNAVMKLWDQTGTLRVEINITSVQSIESDESIHVSTAHLELIPGVYFIHWGTNEYGSVIGVFTVVELEEQISLGAAQFFPMKPAAYDVLATSAGTVKSFSTDENGTITLMGETPIPDRGHVLPLIFDANGLVEGMPTGQFASIAEGQWRMEIPASTITLEPEMTYSVLLFTDDLSIAPSEPFVIEFSPPATGS